MLTFAREMDAALATRSITLQLDGLAHLGTVPLHANTFQRALLNLVHNAMDAMPQGGTLFLRGRREATQVHLDVCDTGTGISPEQCLQIFEPLYTTKPGGTGLGLYIVQEIVTAHGGRIAVQSTLGHGTTFTITLPVEPPPGRRARVVLSLLGCFVRYAVQAIEAVRAGCVPRLLVSPPP